MRTWGQWIKDEAEKNLSVFYPKGPEGATPIAYLWARTIQCEGPGCGAEVPLIRSPWLAKRNARSSALQFTPNDRADGVNFRIFVKERDGWTSQDDRRSAIDSLRTDGTVKRGAATCPCCGYTTPVERVRLQLKERHGGTNDARLLCVVTTLPGQQGRSYRLPNPADLKAAQRAGLELDRRSDAHVGPLSLIPDEVIPLTEIRRISLPLYGMTRWRDVFTKRQHLALTTVAQLVGTLAQRSSSEFTSGQPVAVATILGLAVDRLADSLSASVTWTPGGEFQGHTFARQALAFVSDFAEVNPWCDSSGNWLGAVEWVSKVCETSAAVTTSGRIERASAVCHPLPNDSADALITDPPYYDAVPYSHLSDFFYVWLRRSIGSLHPELLAASASPKEEEIVVDRPHFLSKSTHDIAYYERELQKLLLMRAECCVPKALRR